MKNEQRFLMVTDAARLLNRSVESVRNYERIGKLPATRAANGHRLFRECDVRQLADELSRKGNQGANIREASND